MNITKRKVVDRVLKNHKPFFINIGTYRNIPVQICPLFAAFRILKLRSRDRAYPNSVYSNKDSISIYVVSKIPPFHVQRILGNTQKIAIFTRFFAS